MSTIVRLRFPIIALIFFVLWAPLCANVSALRPVAGNVLLVDNRWQVAVMALVNGLSVIFSLSLMRAVWFRVSLSEKPPSKPGQQSSDASADQSANAVLTLKPWETGHYLLVLLGAAVTPICAYWYSDSELVYEGQEFSLSQAFLAVLLGIALSILVMWFFGYLVGLLIGNKKGIGNFFPGEDRDQNAWLIDLSENPNRHFDMQMLVYFVLIAISFFGILNGLEIQFSWLSVPTCLIVLAWLILMCMTFLSVWLDPHRIPVLLLALLIIIAAQLTYSRPYVLPSAPALADSATTPLLTKFVESIANSTEAFDQFQRLKNSSPEAADDDAVNQHLDRLAAAETKANEADAAIDLAKQELDQLAWSAIRQRMIDATPGKDNKKTLVIVTCPGGGIHAAAWTAHVLEQLNSLYPDFAKSVCLISGVSGGSVGTIFFVNSRYVENSCKAGQINRWQVPAMSSLEAIGAGLAFHDIPTLLIPTLSGEDRGVRLENQWRRRFEHQSEQQTLDAWGKQALAGKMPIVVINATDATSGRRVLFSSIPTPRRPSLDGRVGRPWDYRELIDYKATDIHVATAARASATFPYVSPLSRPSAASPLGTQVAIGDGGYADNEGIVSAVDWLDFLGRQAAIEAKAGRLVPFQRILVLRIQPGSDQDGPLGPPGSIQKFAGYVRWLAGPLEALASMRATSQVERGQLEVDLATSYIDTPWWKLPQNTAAPTAPADSTPTKAELALQSKSGIALPTVQSQLYKGNLKTQRTALNKVRSRSQNVSNDSAAQSKAAQNDNLASQNFVDEPIDSMDYPVAIGILPFIHPEPNKEIPLNWRLSPRQLRWYPQAWRTLVNAASESTSEQEKNVFQLLDKCFNRVKPEQDAKPTN